MKRKVIQLANSTAVISLPSEWVKQFGIKKGDQLNLELVNNSILIQLQEEQKLKSITLDVNNYETFILRLINCLYCRGYDEIQLKYQNISELHLIEKVLHESIGYEIIEQDVNSCTIRNITSGLDEGFNSTLQRIFLITRNFVEFTGDNIEKNNYNGLKSLLDLEITINRLTHFSLRMLVKKTKLDKEQLPFLYNIVSNTEKIADECKFLIYYILESKPLISRDVVKLYNDSALYFVDVYNLYNNFEPKECSRLFRTKDNLLNKIFSIRQKNVQNAIILQYLRNIILNTANTMYDILSLKIQ